MTFRFKDKERPQSYTCALAEQLHVRTVVSFGVLSIELYEPF